MQASRIRKRASLYLAVPFLCALLGSAAAFAQAGAHDSQEENERRLARQNVRYQFDPTPERQLRRQMREAGESGKASQVVALHVRLIELMQKRLGAINLDVATEQNTLAEYLFDLEPRDERNLRLAEQYVRRSLAAREKLLPPESPLVAESVDNLAVLLKHGKRYSEAEALSRRALAIREKTLGPAHFDLSINLGNLAALLEAAGRPEDAEPYMRRALVIRESLPNIDPADLASRIGNHAKLLSELGRYAESAAQYRKALALIEPDGKPANSPPVILLDNFAAVLYAMGRYAEAEPLQRRALQARERAFGPNHDDVARSLSNLGVLLHTTGRYVEAEAVLRRSLAIRERLLSPTDPGIAPSLANLGSLLADTGRVEEAEFLLRKAALIASRANTVESADVAAHLNNLGVMIQIKEAKPAEAEPILRRALTMREKVLGPNHPDTASSVRSLAVLLSDLGKSADAEALFRRALQMREATLGPEHPDVADSLDDLANWLLRAGRPNEALLPLHRALQISQTAGDPQLRWNVLGSLMRAYRQTQPDLAIFFGKLAISAIQRVRQPMAALDPQADDRFKATVRANYQELADLLIERGRLPEAQQVLTMLKEQEVFEYQGRETTRDARKTTLDLTDREAQWYKGFQSAGDQVASLAARREVLRTKARSGPLSAEEQKNLEDLNARLQTARTAFDAYLEAMLREAAQSAGSDARKLDIGARNLTNLRGLQGTLRELGEKGGAPVALLHYLVTDQWLHIILTTSGTQIVRSTAIAEKQLNAKVAAYREVLQNPKSDPLPLAQELYGLILGPVAGDLRETGAETLMVSLDKSLRYLPLQALHDGERFVAERMTVAMFNEAAKDKIKDAPKASWKVGGMGLTQAIPGFSALPAVRAELAGIVRTGSGEGAGGVLPGAVFFDRDFSVARFKQLLQQSYPVMHIASHFVFNPGTEASSYLVMGDGSKLSLQQLREDDFDFGDVDLITLSACETAVGGGSDTSGREIEGLGAQAQRQGAKGVLATLWPVADSSTGLLMRLFYRLRESERLTKGEALRRAQVALIGGADDEAADATRGIERNPGSVAPAITEKGYAHPFFWAPFVLMGNWL